MQNKIKNIIKNLKMIWRIFNNSQWIKDQEYVIKLLKENECLKKDKKKLINQLQIKKNVKFDGEFLWFEKERICLKCYDSSDSDDRCISRLTRNNPEEEESFLCNICKNQYSSIAAKKRLRDSCRNLSQRSLRY